jgi:hypothetical protein
MLTILKVDLTFKNLEICRSQSPLEKKKMKQIWNVSCFKMDKKRKGKITLFCSVFHFRVSVIMLGPKGCFRRLLSLVFLDGCHDNDLYSGSVALNLTYQQFNSNTAKYLKLVPSSFNLDKTDL